MKTTVPTSAPTTRRPGGNDTRAALRHGTGRRDPEHFDPLAIVIDPEVPGAVRDALRARPSHGHSQAMTPSHDQLVRFRDNRPDVPRPPRSRATATMLGWLAAALGILSIAAGIIVSADAFLVLFVLAAADAALAMAASAAARKGKPSFAGGLIPLPPASDLTGYHVMCAGRIYHRRYVRPRVDFDPGALTAWHRAVGAANLIYRAESVRDRVVDTERAEAEVPELLWKIAEGLAKLSDVRIYLKEIVPGAEQFHPAVEAKIKAQERYLARCSGQVSRRIGRLQTVAGKLAAADAARRDEELLKRLVEVEPRILDLVASTDESSTEIDMGEGLKLDADALQQDRPGRAPHDLRGATDMPSSSLTQARSPGRAGSPAMSTAHRLPIPAAWPARSSLAARQWAIVPAGLAPILLTGAYLIAGIFQPASYSPLRTTISVMAGQAGTDRWIMTGGIFLVGGCYLLTAAGLTGVRARARALLVVAGLAGVGIAASPEPAQGASPQHLAWTVLGAVTIAVWPAFAARRASPRSLILSAYGSAAVTAVFVALLGWLFIETREGSVLGLAERLTSSIQTCWPFIIAVTLRRTRRPRPGLPIGGSGGAKAGATARAQARGRRQDW